MANLFGTAGVDTLTGTSANDTIDGAPQNQPTADHGADTLSGGAGNDLINGRDGDDVLNGEGGNDTLNGDNGNDLLLGGAGSDTLSGGNGADQLFGEAGRDTLLGGAGNDLLSGGSGEDVLLGGAGADTLLGDAGNDVIEGGDGNDHLVGGAGNDTLSGGAGADIVDGGAGDDTIEAGAGDIITGGAGTDTAAFSNPSSAYTITHNDGGLTLVSSAGTTQVSGVEKFAFGENELYNLSDVPCYVRGTRILTAQGEMRVEDLRIGDLVVDRFAGRGLRPVRWIGRRSMPLRRYRNPEKAQPIHFIAGALGPDLPRRDLWLSPWHAVYLDGHLIEAKRLVNGTSIRQEDRDTVEYFHIELPEHGILVAEGVEAESYLDAGNRGLFENARVVELDPQFETKVAEGFCAPFLPDGAPLEALRLALGQRAEALLGKDVAAPGAVVIRLAAAG